MRYKKLCETLARSEVVLSSTLVVAGAGALGTRAMAILGSSGVVTGAVVSNASAGPIS